MPRDLTGDDWLNLGRAEKMNRGKDLVARRLESRGATVTPDTDRRSSRLRVHGRTRESEVFVSTQPVGGYALWTKTRLQPASSRFAAIVLLSKGQEPTLFLIPSLDFVDAIKPLTNRDFVGLKSAPEYGVELHAPAVSQLRRYAWSAAREAELLA
jgi:hypothetical protein